MLGRRSDDPMAERNLIQTWEMGRMRSGENPQQGIAWIRIPAGARMGLAHPDEVNDLNGC
jgi:hypothetical protein